MEQGQPQGPFCQSCGMPMTKPEEFGKNADDSQNNEYCCYCFQNGGFTQYNITMEQMIDKVAGMMAKMQGMPLEKAKEMAQALIPKLKRWSQ